MEKVSRESPKKRMRKFDKQAPRTRPNYTKNHKTEGFPASNHRTSPKYPPVQKTAEPLLCNFSGENTNTTKEFSLVVFLSLGTYERLPPGGSWRRKATEGERVIMRSI
jgi:hypothetical protein